jgi:acyl-ACP thioesterase
MNSQEKTGKYHFKTESYLLDFRGHVTIPMIGNYLLHAASHHASQRGFGYSDMTERHTAWVLSRMVIEIKRYPTMSEPVTLYTWIDEVGRFVTSRCFELNDEAGETIGYARSIWAAIDVKTRRPTLLDEEALNVYRIERDCPIEKPGRIAAIEDEVEGTPYRIKYSDLDINGHFNSIKYMEHLLDLFELDLFRRKEVRRFEIAYLSEGWYDMPLTLHRKETDPDCYHLAICTEKRAICRAIVTWEQVEREE